MIFTGSLSEQYIKELYQRKFNCIPFRNKSNWIRTSENYERIGLNNFFFSKCGFRASGWKKLRQRLSFVKFIVSNWIEYTNVGLGLVYGVYHFQHLRATIFQLFRGSQFYWWRKQSIRRKLQTCDKSQTNFITSCFNE